jgi:translocation protein SEC63
MSLPKRSDQREKREYLSAEEERKQKRLLHKQKKNANPYSGRRIFLVLGWLMFAYVLYQVVHTKIEEFLWDPYEILGVDSSVDQAGVRRAFRKLSLKYHPDKVTENKDEAEKKFVDISKAYKVLTDEDARKTFEEFGHPDGKQSFALGIALPAWLVVKENSPFVLLAYALIFGIALPMYVARWWYKTKDLTKQKILNVTMARYYKEVKENTTMKKLLEILCIAEEFKGPVFDKLSEKVLPLP